MNMLSILSRSEILPSDGQGLQEAYQRRPPRAPENCKTFLGENLSK